MPEFPYKRLWFTHIFIIVLSNYAVQIPLTIFSINTTVGAFTYPFIFLTTDLTVRLYGQHKARRVIFAAMIPALILSYIVGTIFEHGTFCGFGSVFALSVFVLRITAASLSAYVAGQLADIFVFQRLRELKTWWIAPACSSVFGNLLDTIVFFSVAFYHSPDPFMAAHWVEIATVDYACKLAANLSIFVPLYGLLLKALMRLFKPQLAALTA